MGRTRKILIRVVVSGLALWVSQDAVGGVARTAPEKLRSAIHQVACLNDYLARYLDSREGPRNERGVDDTSSGKRESVQLLPTPRPPHSGSYQSVAVCGVFHAHNHADLYIEHDAPITAVPHFLPPLRGPPAA